MDRQHVADIVAATRREIGVSDLIDTTEMYLRTVYELQEEGVEPLRARIAERLGQSGPTVSQTVARMERDGLLVVGDDRRIALTDQGAAIATRVMRKHRLAERLLVDIIGLPWEDVHAEACRWEHVMSERVERRLLELLDHPDRSPFGNPIPGLQELDPNAETSGPSVGLPLADCATDEVQWWQIASLAEPVQDDQEVLAALHRVGAVPGAAVKVRRNGDRILVGSAGEYTELSQQLAQNVLVHRS